MLRTIGLLIGSIIAVAMASFPGSGLAKPPGEGISYQCGETLSRTLASDILATDLGSSSDRRLISRSCVFDQSIDSGSSYSRLIIIRSSIAEDCEVDQPTFCTTILLLHRRSDSRWIMAVVRDDNGKSALLTHPGGFVLGRVASAAPDIAFLNEAGRPAAVFSFNEWAGFYSIVDPEDGPARMWLARPTPMRFERVGSSTGCAGCLVIDARGDIVFDTPKALTKFLADNSVPSGSTIKLTSDGGNVRAGLALGAVISAHALNTEVPSEPLRERTATSISAGRCASSCILAFFAGNHRTLPRGDRLGFHSFAETYGTASEIEGQDMSPSYAYGLEQLTQAAEAFVEKRGISKDAIAFMRAVPASFMCYPTQVTLARWSIIKKVQREPRALAGTYQRFAGGEARCFPN